MLMSMKSAVGESGFLRLASVTCTCHLEETGRLPTWNVLFGLDSFSSGGGIKPGIENTCSYETSDVLPCCVCSKCSVNAQLKPSHTSVWSQRSFIHWGGGLKVFQVTYE